MVSAVPQTTNFKLSKPTFDYKLYHDLVNNNWDVVDAILNQYLLVQNVVGVWQNSTTYTVGQRVIDSLVGTIYNCEIAHTSAASPTTFATDRANNPTYWTSLSQAAHARGLWTSGVQYQVNDFVVNGNIFAVALDAHVAGASFAGDAAHWAYLIDLSSFSIPSGVGHSLQYIRQNVTETGQEYVSAATVLAQINNAAILAQIAAANVFTTIPQQIQNVGVGDFLILLSTDAGAAESPVLTLDRNSASPVATDFLGRLNFRGRSSTGVPVDYGRVRAEIVDTTNGTHAGRLSIGGAFNGGTITAFYFQQGLFSGGATGGDKGADAINAKKYYQDGSLLSAFGGTKSFVENGDCEIWQRGTSIAIAASTTIGGTGSYSLDRWAIGNGANQALTISQQPGLTNGSRFCARIQRNAAQTGTGQIIFVHPLTVEFAKALRGQIVTISAQLRAGANWSPASGNLTIRLISGTGTTEACNAGSYTGPTDVAAVTTPLTTAVVKASATGTVGGTVGQMLIEIDFTPVGVAGAADYFELDEVVIEIGSNASDVFDRRPLALELLACQRQYYKTFPMGTAPVQNGGVTGAINVILGTGQSGVNGTTVLLPVVMRAVPAVTSFNPSAANANVRDTTGAADRAITVGTLSDHSIPFTFAGGVAATTNVVHFVADASIPT